jgi:dCTP deaminase
MSVLSKQSIRALCYPSAARDAIPDKHRKPWHPLIHPFNPGKLRQYGVSSGSGPASYDATIAHDLVLGRHPGFVIREWILNLRYTIRPKWYEWPYLIRYFMQQLMHLQDALAAEPPHYALAHTVEDFCLPANVKGDVCDKSTFARGFVSAYNTLFDPGFHGNATLELVNDSDRRIEYKAGMGVCQFVFTWLDEPTEEPYSGKYNGQTKAAHGPRYEADDPQ